MNKTQTRGRSMRAHANKEPRDNNWEAVWNSATDLLEFTRITILKSHGFSRRLDDNSSDRPAQMQTNNDDDGLAGQSLTRKEVNIHDVAQGDI